MTRALFYTTKTVDCLNHVRAWKSVFGETVHLAFDHNGIRNDWQLPNAIRDYGPDVVFYIGAHSAPGNPKYQTLGEARKLAPMINICSDAADTPWHPVLERYRKHECFDLQVSIDGARDVPVDYATLTPIDPRAYAVKAQEKDIRCGFSGTVGRWNERSETVLALKWFGGLTVRDRLKSGGYGSHADFLRRCRMVLNISRTGSGLSNHIKGRVLEAGWAGAALLESEGSPIGDWFPADCYLTYRDPKEAAAMIADTDDATLDRVASRLAEEVRARFTPRDIYGAILERAGLRVGPSVAA